MLITNKFIMINNPKTGSTFARKAIRAVVDYQPNVHFVNKSPNKHEALDLLIELSLPNLRGNLADGAPDHHGTYSQIPVQYRTLQVMSIWRNPFSLIVSQYEYRHWAVNPWLPRELLSRAFPKFPELSLWDFLKLQELAMRLRWGITFEESGFGPLSAHFIQMFALKPEDIFLAIREDGWVGDLRDKLGRVTYLRQELSMGME